MEREKGVMEKGRGNGDGVTGGDRGGANGEWEGTEAVG